MDLWVLKDKQVVLDLQESGASPAFLGRVASQDQQEPPVFQDSLERGELKVTAAHQGPSALKGSLGIQVSTGLMDSLDTLETPDSLVFAEMSEWMAQKVLRVLLAWQGSRVCQGQMATRVQRAFQVWKGFKVGLG